MASSFSFADRHIGPSADDISEMLRVVGVASVGELIGRTLPDSIRSVAVDGSCQSGSKLPQPLTEPEALAVLRRIADQNRVFRSFIGMGYYNTVTPAVIRRLILENPGWYTQYTPYQAEISQGRLEALLNFQTVVAGLTGLEFANASMLDEGTAAAEAMTLAYRLRDSRTRPQQNEVSCNRFFVSDGCHPQTIEVVKGRAEPLGIEVVYGDAKELKLDGSYFGALVQYPATDGSVADWSDLASKVHQVGAYLVVATDLLSLTLLKPPGEWGADIAVGNSQRFGVPLGFGGPHAAFFATRYEFSRFVPGRIVGVSKDVAGNVAYRLAVQVREQHIKREKATSNICTAQVLLAVMAGMYAVYHGPEGLREIALRVHRSARMLAVYLQQIGFNLKHQHFFDTICVVTDRDRQIHQLAAERGFNFRHYDNGVVGVALDETVTEFELREIGAIFAEALGGAELAQRKPLVSSCCNDLTGEASFPDSQRRSTKFLQQSVFHRYRSETELMRYIYRLQSRDLSLTTSMIPLGSCTMKLNAAAELEPVSWPAFGGIHPFAPLDQAAGYLRLFGDLEGWLSEITGMDAVSLQPNAGSQGEYAGLLVIRAYQRARGESQRDIVLIPDSAHGTNPASAALAGCKVIGVSCDEQGNVSIEDLQKKLQAHGAKVLAIMVTYPSTHGVFEEGIREICARVHEVGAQVYLDGANLNAQVGLTLPGSYGVDVCHINLHKTFCIPHGGGGPGVGPIAVRAHLKPFLPGSRTAGTGEKSAIPAVSAAPWGSAGILMIPWMYIAMMGAAGLRRATEIAILNANYIAKRLEGCFPVLYRGREGFVAHECILDLRTLKKRTPFDVTDVAKRLMDFGFHSPTVSFPVAETLMIEPTESESRAELDRFCDAVIAIKAEIDRVVDGGQDAADNPLKNAPHTAGMVIADDWPHRYTREQAAFPVPWLRDHKYWPSVRRIDSAYGDRNLFCSCS